MTEPEYSIAVEQAKEAFRTLSCEGWIDLVQAARQITMDAMSLNDVPCIALAICRAKRLNDRLNGAAT